MMANREAYNRIAITAIAVERFRRANDRLPESLEQLAPHFLSEPLLDPFTDQPLKYMSGATDFCIYSVGSDRSDDGGHETNPGVGIPDCVFRSWLPNIAGDSRN